jgi:hypothetical protein
MSNISIIGTGNMVVAAAFIAAARTSEIVR